jgi:hypothetical protein
MAGRKTVDPVIRLMNSIKLSTDGCWNWVGAKTTNEHGDILPTIGMPDGKGKYTPRGSHRISFEFFVGSIPEEMYVHRKCNNLLCVNPSHLELITPVECIYRSKHGRAPRDILVRLMDRFELSSDGCWNWTGKLDRDGYGSISLYPKSDHIRKTAHRCSYELFVGEVTAGLQLHHKCENPRCINPSHLEPLSPGEHVLESPNMLQSINAAKTHCIHGHPLFGANLYVWNGHRGCRECRKKSDHEKYFQKLKNETRSEQTA